MRKVLSHSFAPACIAFSLALFSGTARGQQLISSSLPDAPDMTLSDGSDQQASGQSNPSSPQHQDGQTSRILGIIPNFRAVNANVHLPPQTIKDKFVTASQDSFDYSSFLLPGALAGFNQARNATPEFGQGARGYGRYYWHSFVDQTSENYWVEFIVPAIMHEDTRYYTLGSGGFVKRAKYSLSRIVVTRNDAGKNVFNSGEIVGAGAAAGISNLYYPSRERTFGNTAQQWGTNVGIDAATYLFKEFWPDLNHRLFHGKAGG